MNLPDTVQWHLYRLEMPLDFGWDNLPIFDRYADACANESMHDPGFDAFVFHAKLNIERDAVLDVARDALHWEGDVRGYVHIFVLPGTEGSVIHGYVWKQDNNGITFVASPVAIKFPTATHTIIEIKTQRYP
jgi:hypothetical protein